MLKPLKSCTQSTDGSTTGWARKGSCNWDPTDSGYHEVCVSMSDEFLQQSAKHDANDLTSVVQAGGHWCICAWAWAAAVKRDPKRYEGIHLECERTNMKLREVYGKYSPTATTTAMSSTTATTTTTFCRRKLHYLGHRPPLPIGRRLQSEGCPPYHSFPLPTLILTPPHIFYYRKLYKLRHRSTLPLGSGLQSEGRPRRGQRDLPGPRHTPDPARRRRHSWTCATHSYDCYYFCAHRSPRRRRRCLQRRS